MSGQTALSQPFLACSFLKEALVGPVTIGSTPYGASEKASAAAVSSTGKAGASMRLVSVECATPTASSMARAAVPTVARKILENTIVMPVNRLGAKTIRLG